MFKTIKAVLNSLNEKPYLKNINDLKLYDLTSKNRIFLKDNSKEMKDINELEGIFRHQNLKIYVKNMAKIRGIQTFLVTLPAILCAGSIFSFNVDKTLKTKSLDTYKKNVIEFDEEYLYQDVLEDTVYTCNPTWILKYFDENTVDLASIQDKVIIYFGDGANTVKVEFNISDTNTLNVNDSYIDNYFDLEKKDSTKVVEIDEKYSKLIKEAADIYINYIETKSNFDAQEIEERKKLIEEVINNEKNDIRVFIEQYIENGKMDLSYYRDSTGYIVCAIFIDFVYLVVFLISLSTGTFKKIGDLSLSKFCLCENDKDLNIYEFFYAPLKYREAYLKAEKERIFAINEILKSHDGSSDILSQYEKKLIKKEEE